MKDLFFRAIAPIASVALAAAMFTACGKGIRKITLDKAELVLFAGETESLSATLKPDSADKNAIAWSSGDTGVATVAEDGTVTALAQGKATIWVSAEGLAAKKCDLKVHPVDVYVAGSTEAGATLWKNGSELYRLNTGVERGRPGKPSIAVSGNDVYVGGGYLDQRGYEKNEIAMVWKNGKTQRRLSGLSSSEIEYYPFLTNCVIAVTDDDVYTLTYNGDDRQALGYTGSDPMGFVVWKNGEALHRWSDGTFFDAMAVSSKEVYVAGYAWKQDENDYVATVWKNGNVLYRMSDAYGVSLTAVENDVYHYVPFPSSIAVSGNDVYVAGRERTPKDKNVATVWKNGEVLHRLNDGSYNAHSASIAVSGNDVYVAGSERTPKGKSVATVWKNGSVLHRLTDGSYDASGDSIAVLGNDVIVAGDEQNSKGKSVATVWKNGGVLYRLGNGKFDCYGSSVFVK
jgi:hypothetical protein